MSYKKPTKRQIIQTPPTATEDLHNTCVLAFTDHFSTILTPTLMIAHRKGCYATVINGTIKGVTLEQTLGTENAKIATEQILNGIASRYSEVTR